MRKSRGHRPRLQQKVAEPFRCCKAIRRGSLGCIMPKTSARRTLMKPAKVFATVVCCLVLVLTTVAQISERINVDAVEKIKAESMRASQVMDVAGVLTNTYGPRLTNSPNARAAGEYTRKKLVEWKLQDVRLEPWNFGNGWTNDKFSIKVVSDPGLTLLAYPKAWTVGTAGPVTAPLVEGVIASEADFARLR